MTASNETVLSTYSIFEREYSITKPKCVVFSAKSTNNQN